LVRTSINCKSRAAASASQSQASFRVASISSYSATLPTGKRIKIIPNKYEAKRANIVIYNWDAYADQKGNFKSPCTGACATATIDLSIVFSSGDPFVIRDAQNFGGPPVVSGSYSGPLSVPLTGLAKAAVMNIQKSDGSQVVPAHTAPGYGAFVVCSPDCGLGADVFSTRPSGPVSAPRSRGMP